jgi:hypothetical protein
LGTKDITGCKFKGEFHMSRVLMIMVFVFGMKSLQAQTTKPALIIQLEQLCKAITSPETGKQKVFDAFYFTDAVLKQGDHSENPEGFQLDTTYTLESEKSIGPLREAHSRTLTTYKKDGRLYYQLSFVLGNTYTLSKTGQVQYKQANDPLNLSYPELNTSFGKPISVFGSIPQPKDTKHYYYLYTNPKTKQQAVLSLVSYNDPAADYNTLYKVTLANREIKAMRL